MKPRNFPPNMFKTIRTEVVGEAMVVTLPQGTTIFPQLKVREYIKEGWHIDVAQRNLN